MQLTKQTRAFVDATKTGQRASRQQRVCCRAQLRQQQQQQQSHTLQDLLKRSGAAALSGAVALSLLCSGGCIEARAEAMFFQAVYV